MRIVVKLLSPPVPSNLSVSGSGSHLIGHMPMLSAILFGVSCGDIVHILSFYGVVSRVLLCNICYSHNSSSFLVSFVLLCILLLSEFNFFVEVHATFAAFRLMNFLFVFLYMV